MLASTLRQAAGSALRVLLLSTLGLLGLAGGLAIWGYRAFASDLPQALDVVTDYRPIRASQIFSADGETIGEFFVEKRVLVREAQIPQVVRQAFVAAEDNRFFQHGGVDYLGIGRAAWANLRAGHVVQGGSTITQQVAKLLILGQEKSLARKVREALLAFRIEGRLSKDQILAIYLNHVYLGHGAYGIAAAAAAYFGKSVSDLTVAEAAMLAALPKAPGNVTPLRDFERARARQHYVLDQMVALGFLDRGRGDAARQEPLGIVSRGRALTNVAAPYFVETVRRYVADRLGDEELLQRGFHIHTTLDMRRQRAAEAALRRGLEELQGRLGFAGPLGHLEGEDRRRFEAGLPRPLGPEGFNGDDPEQSGLLVAVPPSTPEPDAALLDATRPGAELPEAAAQRSAAAQPRPGRRRPGRRAAVPPPPLPPTDPATLYAAVVTRTGAEGKPLAVASGALVAPLDPADEARLSAWRGRAGEGISAGDVLPVFFRPPSAPVRPGSPPLVAVLSTAPKMQGALVALDPRNGHLVSMVGGYDYDVSQFNRAVQARRQIGSAIKPFIYAAAIERGMTAMTVKWDVPVKFKTASGVWAPHNYRPEYLGPLTLRTALAKSINTISAQLVAQMGVDAAIEMMRRLGLTSKLPASLSLALGTADLGLQETAYALAAFPAGGRLVTPVFITKLIDADGRVLEDHTIPAPPVQRLAPDTAFIVTDLMRGVVEVGTARKARELGRPAAGKTGTSTNYRDAWFYGFTPELLCGVWVGRDDFKPIGHDATGGQVALPIWLAYMREALRGQPVLDFAPPPGIVFARADPDKGVPAPPSQPGSRLMPFRRGTLPAAFTSAVQGARFLDERF